MLKVVCELLSKGFVVFGVDFFECIVKLFMLFFYWCE